MIPTYNQWLASQESEAFRTKYPHLLIAGAPAYNAARDAAMEALRPLVRRLVGYASDCRYCDARKTRDGNECPVCETDWNLIEAFTKETT